MTDQALTPNSDLQESDIVAKQTEDQAPLDLSAPINMGDVSAEFEPLAKGRYRAIIEDGEVRTGNTSGQPYINFQYDLIDESGKQWSVASLQPKALWRLKQMMVRAGVPAEQCNGSLTVDEIIQLLKNREVVLVIDVEDYTPRDSDERKKRNVVKDVLGPDAEVGSGSSGKKRRSF